MNPQLTQPILLLLGVVLVASVVGSLIYSALRFLESHAKSGAFIGSLLVIGTLLYVVTSGKFSPTYTKAFYFAILFGFIGSFLHRKSVGNRVGFTAAFALMSAVTLLNLTANIVLMETKFVRLDSIYFATRSFSNVYMTLLVLIMTQSITAPFLFWVWKSSRLRPGVDKHLES